jgi:hypothetical protein
MAIPTSKHTTSSGLPMFVIIAQSCTVYSSLNSFINSDFVSGDNTAERASIATGCVKTPCNSFIYDAT